MGGDVNGCGLCAKYSLFIANFIMFVSDTHAIHLLADFNYEDTIFVLISDWRSRSVRFGHLDIG